MTGENTETIVITGFGPFRNFKINASWEAVKAFMAMPDTKKLPVKVVAEEIPVSYEHVLQRVPDYHTVEQPALMIHVGVSSAANRLTLEKQAFKDDYTKLDVDGKLPENNSCVLGCEPSLSTVLNVEALAEDVNRACIGVEACTSDDAGRYLCEFIYYASLTQNYCRSLFIHVPELGKPYSAEQLGRGLFEIVRLAVEQLSENDLVDKNLIDKSQGASAL